MLIGSWTKEEERADRGASYLTNTLLTLTQIKAKVEQVTGVRGHQVGTQLQGRPAEDTGDNGAVLNTAQKARRQVLYFHFMFE